MRILICLILIGISGISNAQYSMQWYSIYDNPHPSYNDYAVDIAEDTNGNTYVTGTSYQMELTDDWRYDFATVKYNSNGDSVWVRRYDASVGNEIEDNAVAIGIDANNFIYVTGNSYGPEYSQVTTIKYNDKGDQIWVRKYHDTLFNYNSFVTDMKVESAGNVFIASSGVP